MKNTKIPAARKARFRSKELTGESIDAMSDAQKARLVREMESQTPEQRLAESRPLNATERAQWRRIKKRIGRPRIGNGVKAISLTVEKSLLSQADAYAKRHGLKRTELFAEGVRLVIGARNSIG